MAPYRHLTPPFPCRVLQAIEFLLQISAFQCQFQREQDSSESFSSSFSVWYPFQKSDNSKFRSIASVASGNTPARSLWTLYAAKDSLHFRNERYAPEAAGSYDLRITAEVNPKPRQMEAEILRMLDRKKHTHSGKTFYLSSLFMPVNR